MEWLCSHWGVPIASYAFMMWDQIPWAKFSGNTGLKEAGLLLRWRAASCHGSAAGQLRCCMLQGLPAVLLRRRHVVYVKRGWLGNRCHEQVMWGNLTSCSPERTFEGACVAKLRIRRVHMRRVRRSTCALLLRVLRVPGGTATDVAPATHRYIELVRPDFKIVAGLCKQKQIKHACSRLLTNICKGISQWARRKLGTRGHDAAPGASRRGRT
jgi:hypothetical protein